jgi:hypothetical protein
MLFRQKGLISCEPDNFKPTYLLFVFYSKTPNTIIDIGRFIFYEIKIMLNQNDLHALL